MCMNKKFKSTLVASLILISYGALASDCPTLDQLSSKNTPVMLYQHIVECINDNQYEKAVSIHALASIYYQYDKKRVLDKSAHQVSLVLQDFIITKISDDDLEKFNTLVTESFRRKTSLLLETCKSIRVLNKPTYYPDYMIDYGMQSYLKNKDTVIDESIKGSEIWEDLLKTYLHCPL